MGCLDIPEVREVFERSNIPPEEWPARAAQLDEVHRQEGFNVASIDELSLVEVHLKPDGTSMGAEAHMLGVIRGIGLMLVREVGGFIRKRRVDSQFMVFSDVPGIAYYADDRENGHGWGDYSVQGVLRGGQPVMRISWPYSHRGSRPQTQPSSALRERERILSVLPQ